MSKIDELLKNEKVEWKKLGEIATCFAGGTPKTTNKSYYDGEIPWIRSGEIKFNIIKSSERNITIEGLNNSSAKLIRPNSVVVAMTGATVGRSAVVEFETSSNQSVAAIETNESIIKYKYLFYYLADKYEELKGMGQGALTSLNLGTIKKLIIPIPSLKTQEKIVEILDKFTNYVTELQAELQAELQDRTKQYEYYRDMLLSEDYLSKLARNPELIGLDNRIKITTLGEIGKFTRGNGLQKKDFVSKGKPVIHYGQIYTKYNFESNKTFSFVNDDVFSKLKKANCNDILIATTSENIEDVGKAVVWLGDEEIGFSGDMYSYSTTQNSKYIAYYLQTTEFQRQKEKKVTGTKLIRIHGDDMAKFSISLPPINIQNKVVEVLDKFQALLADTEGLLPQEIEQRQKQYEYFREKLLTFNENVVQVKSSQVKSSQVKSSQVKP